jgi:hypothetical protein
MKFKIGFTIEAETLFRALSQFLPIDDLHVEEVAPTLAAQSTPQWPPQTPLAKKTERLAKPMKRRKGPGPNLTAGINRIVVEALSNKPHRAMDLRPLLKSGGYSHNSVTSRLEDLRNHGVIEQMGDGLWRLTSHLKRSA